MIESTFRAVFAGSSTILYGDWEKLTDISLEEHRQLGMRAPVFTDSCHAFNLETADQETFQRALEKFNEAQRKRGPIEALKQKS
jgi:hypothetical protein